MPLVHVDQTPESAAARVRRHTSAEDAPKLLQKRFQIINLWRPISHTAWDWPLALCDYSSIDYKRDLIPTTLKYPDRDGETYSVAFNESHRWKYVRGMTPDDIVLIKWYVPSSPRVCATASDTPHVAMTLKKMGRRHCSQRIPPSRIHPLLLKLRFASLSS